MVEKSAAFELGLQAYARGDFETARAALADELKIQPNNADLLRRYADACLRTESKEEAWEALRHLLILEPANMAAAQSMARLVVKTRWLDKDGLIRRARRLDKARKAASGSWFKRALGRGREVDAPPEPERLPGLDDEQNKSYGAAVKALKVLDYDRALALLTPLCDACPGEPELLRCKGKAFEGLIALGPAIEAFDAAVAAGGGEDPEVLGPRISSAVLNGTSARAEALLAEVPEHLCEAPAVLVAEAVLHEYHGRIDQALAAMDKADAHKQMPDVADLRARILAGQGRFDELGPALEEWIRRAPLAPHPFNLAAQSKLLAPGTPIFAAAEALAENPEASQHGRAGVCFALAFAKEQAGEQTEAFELFERANMQVNVGYDAAQEEQKIASLKATMTAEVIARAGTGTRGEGLVFVCGLPRSGSTLAETILSAHAEARAIGESQVFVAALQRATEMGYPETADGLSDAFLAELAEFYRDNLPEYARDSRFVIDKELIKFMHLGLLRMVFPAARIVHTRRHPMDVCYSMYKHSFRGWPASYRLETLAHFHWLHDEIMAHWNNAMPGQIHELRYEDMVADAETEIRALLDAAAMPFHPDCLEFHKSRNMVKTASVRQVRSRIYSSSVGAWEPHSEALTPLREGLGLP